MSDDAGYRLVVAPRFSVPLGFERRLDRNGGVQFEGERIHPRNDWRPLGADETKAVVGESVGPDEILPPDRLGLVTIPERLRAAWWVEAERSAIGPSTGSFDSQFAQMVEFFNFKRLPIPGKVSLVATATAPGLPFTRMNPHGTPEGLGFGEPAPTLACINLGDEATFIVLLEVPPALIARRLEKIGVTAAWSLGPSALTRQYFVAFPNQPLLRMRLQAGEGIWFSPQGVVHDGWTDGKSDVDVMLTVASGEPGFKDSPLPLSSPLRLPLQVD